MYKGKPACKTSTFHTVGTFLTATVYLQNANHFRKNSKKKNERARPMLGKTRLTRLATIEFFNLITQI
jgi:hypothetical protein